MFSKMSRTGGLVKQNETDSEITECFPPHIGEGVIKVGSRRGNRDPQSGGGEKLMEYTWQGSRRSLVDRKRYVM